MHPDQPVFGFDASADGGELTVVVLRRDGEHWQVEHCDPPDPPDPPDMSRVVARIGQPRPAGGPLAARLAAAPPLHDQVTAWMDTHVGTTLELTDEQRALVQATFTRLAADGKITFPELRL